MIRSWARLIIPNVWETRQSSWSGSSVFALEKWSKYLNFQSFFTSFRPFGGYFQWNACIYFQKICIWTRYSDAKLIKNISNFLVTLLRFSFRKQPKNLNIQEFFTSFRHFGGYYQWNTCIYFQKTCIWTSYSDAKLIKNISNFFVTLLCFCFIKQPKNLNFQRFFTSKRHFFGYFQRNACTYFQKTRIWTK